MLLLNHHIFEWSIKNKAGLGMTCPPCHPHKSRTMRLRWAMKSLPKGKAAWTDIAHAKSKIAPPELILIDLT